MVEVGPAHVKALTTQELQSWGITGYGESKGLAPGVFAQQVGPGGVNDQLIGDGSQRRQDAAAPYDYSCVGLPHHGERDLIVQVVHHARDTAALQVYQSVGQGDVVLPDELVIAKDVLLEFGTVPAKVLRRPRPSGHRHVEKVGGAGHHAASGPGPPGHHIPAPVQVIVGLGKEERKPHRFSAAGRGVGHLLPQAGLVLQVVEGGHRADAVAQSGMGRYVLNPFPADPHLPGTLAETVDVLGSCLRWHISLSRPRAGWLSSRWGV